MDIISNRLSSSRHRFHLNRCADNEISPGREYKPIYPIQQQLTKY